MALLEYKCPNCGGGIQFNPGTRELLCPYCEAVMDVEALKAMDEDMSRDHASEAIDWGYQGSGWGAGEQQGMAVYSCQSCSGEIIGDETLGSTTCPFCDNPIVITSKFAGTLRPDMILPFKLGKDHALSSLEKHYLGKRLLPAVFKTRNHMDEVKGVYVPFWLYSADADAHVQYRATKVRRWSDRNYDYTETSTFRIIRDGGIGFDNVPADGSRAIDDTLMESIEPFNVTEAAAFHPAYMAGYFANKYDVTAEECAGRANDRIRNSTEAAFKSTVVGYNTVVPEYTNIRLISGGVRYALLPVWLLGTTWQNKSFLFAMNGQTGKFVGDLPLDKAAYRAWLLKIFGIVAGALLLISQVIISFL